MTNLSSTDKASAAYSAIKQMINDIQLRVTAGNLKEMGESGQLMSYINLTPTTVSILSKLLHITADTLIDGNVITNGMIKAGAVTTDKIAAKSITADKMSLQSLSAISANLGTVTSGTIKGNTIIGSVFKNEDGSFSIDSEGNIKGANITGSSLNLTTNDLKVMGMQIRAVSFLKGDISTGGIIPLPAGYDYTECIWWIVPNGDYIFNIDSNRRVTFKHLDSTDEKGDISVRVTVPIRWSHSYRIDTGKGTQYIDINISEDGVGTDRKSYTYKKYYWSEGGSGTYYVLGVKST